MVVDGYVAVELSVAIIVGAYEVLLLLRLLLLLVIFVVDVLLLMVMLLPRRMCYCYSIYVMIDGYGMLLLLELVFNGVHIGGAIT